MRVKQRCLEASAIAPNTHFWEKLKPDQTPTPSPCPKSMSAIAVSSGIGLLTVVIVPHLH